MFYLIIMLIYLPIYIILIMIFVSMNLFNQMVPIYVLSENNIDLFDKKSMHLYHLNRLFSEIFTFFRLFILLYILYIALTLVGD